MWSVFTLRRLLVTWLFIGQWESNEKYLVDPALGVMSLAEKVACIPQAARLLGYSGFVEPVLSLTLFGRQQFLYALRIS